MNLQQFYALAQERYLQNRNERYGQAHMNLLSEVNPELARSVTNTSLDPYYTDSSQAPEMENFKMWLQYAWEELPNAK
jgi:hypothetical protein